MRRRSVVRCLLALLAFSAVAADTVAKVVHGVAHSAERQEADRERTLAADFGDRDTKSAVEAHYSDADHAPLHVVTVAQRVGSVSMLTVVEGSTVSTAVVVAVEAARPVVTDLARPPDPDGQPAQSRAPPIG